MRVVASLFAVIAVINAMSVSRRQSAAPVQVSLTRANNAAIFNQTISEGNDLSIQFSLGQTLICPASDRNCRVLILLDNQRPDELVLSACHVEWYAGDPLVKTITVSVVENFIDDGERTFLIIPRPIQSSALAFANYSLPAIRINTAPKNVANCHSITDPNYRQFDGRNFVINTAGTFLLWAAPLRDWVVQARVNAAGFNCGVAIRDGCSRIVFDRCSGNGLVIRQYPTSQTDMTVQRSSQETYMITSARAGSVVQVTERIRITQSGRVLCGWSGCRTIYTTSRQDWLDIVMTAPGRDWGLIDGTSNPRTYGVCGNYDSSTSGDLRGMTADSFVTSWRLTSGSTLFETTPTPCVTVPPPVAVNASLCATPPFTITIPILNTVDTEDITNLILGDRGADDRLDDRINYVFGDDGANLTRPVRTAEFNASALLFCTEALIDTTAARMCGLLNPPVNVSSYIFSCYEDVQFQANETAFSADPLVDTGSLHIFLAEAQVALMEQFCIRRAIQSGGNGAMVCTNPGPATCGTYCLSVSTNASAPCQNRCIGAACTFQSNNPVLTASLNSECPANCSFNSRRSDTYLPGVCVQNTNGTNYCRCSPGYAGDTCSILVTEVPDVYRIFPYFCFTNNGSCPPFIDVHGDEFYASQNLTCKFTVTGSNQSYMTSGLVMGSSTIRCDTPAIQYVSGATETVLDVAVSMDGSVFTTGLPLSVFDGTCKTCDRFGDCTQLPNTCIVDNTCYANEAFDPQHPECGVCNASVSTTSFVTQYVNFVCGPTINPLPGNAQITVSETQAVGVPISHSFLPFALQVNTRTGDDARTPTVWTLGQSCTINACTPFTGPFNISSTGQLSLSRGLDYETTNNYTFTVSASRGALSSRIIVTVAVLNVDEATVFARARYNATIAENTPTASLVTVVATDGDGNDPIIGMLSYSLLNNFSVFTINAVTGVIGVAAPGLDYEGSSSYALTVIARTLAGGEARTMVNVTVTDMNEAPTSVRLFPGFVNEHTVPGEEVGVITVVDPDMNEPSPPTLTLVNNAGGRFAIVGQTLVVRAGAPAIDFEGFAAGVNPTYTIQIRATDYGGLTVTTSIEIAVRDINDAPSVVSITQLGSMTPLTSLNEDQPLGAIATLSVMDQDSIDTHTFYINATASTFSGFAIVDNQLLLTAPLDFERQRSVVCGVYASDSNGAMSPTYSFTIAVNDRPDVPGYFVFTPAFPYGVPENTATGTVIGTITGLDQDGVGSQFTINVTSPLVTVGPTTCALVVGGVSAGYMRCIANVTLAPNVVLNYETSQITAGNSAISITVVAGDSATQIPGSGSVTVRILNVPEAPSGVTVTSSGPVQSSQPSVVVVEEGQNTGSTIATIGAMDEDDLCSPSVTGCTTQVSTGSYNFTLTPSSSTLFTLTPSCARMHTAVERALPVNQCNVTALQTSSLTATTPTQTVSVVVTDESGRSTITTITVTFVMPQLRIMTSMSAIPPTSAVASTDALGTLTLTGWTEPTAPVVIVNGALFTVTAPQQIRRTVQDWQYRIGYANGAVVDWVAGANNQVTFNVTVVPTGSFAGVTYTRTFDVLQASGQPFRAFVCDAARSSCTLASASSITLSDDQAAGTAAVLQFRNTSTVDASLTFNWVLRGTSPSTSMITVNPTTGVLSTSASPASLGVAGAVTAVIEVVATSSSVRLSTTFQITITVADDCAGVTCGGHGTCQDQVGSYLCVCDSPYFGTNCGSTAVAVTEPTTAVYIDIIDMSASSAEKKSSMASGAVAAIVIVLVMILLVLFALMLFLRNKREKDADVVNQIFLSKVSNNVVESVSNPMYGTWFQPNMSKEDAYSSLSAAKAGSFVIRSAQTAVAGLNNPTYAMHVKNSRGIIQDELITKDEYGMFLASSGEGARKFPSLPALVSFYEEPRGLNFVLSPDRTIRNVVYAQSEEIYDNSAIKNTRVVDDSSLPVKASQMGMVKKIAGTNDDMYTNAKEARALHL